MKEYEYKLVNGSLYYEITEDGISVTRYSGMGIAAEIPVQIDGISVTEIAKKAFLSKKTLKRILLPETIRNIGDWAFAYCDNLEKIVIGSSNIQIGKAVFMECKNLSEIEISGKAGFVSHLMAAAASMDAYYLLDMADAGNDEWISKWDSRMFTAIYSPDTEGYSKQVLCGEEDYGSTDLEAYKSNRRKLKVRLAFLRLLNSEGLSSENRNKLIEYCVSHTKGCRTDEAWQVIRDELNDDRKYYELFADIGCLNSKNITEILADIGEKSPEMKAFFIRYNDENSEHTDFFEDLEL